MVEEGADGGGDGPTSSGDRSLMAVGPRTTDVEVPVLLGEKRERTLGEDLPSVDAKVHRISREAGETEEEEERDGCPSGSGKKWDLEPWEQHGSIISLARFDYKAATAAFTNRRKGFLITCGFRREKSATNEALALLREVIQGYASHGRLPGDGIKIEQDNPQCLEDSAALSEPSVGITSSGAERAKIASTLPVIGLPAQSETIVTPTIAVIDANVQASRTQRGSTASEEAVTNVEGNGDPKEVAPVATRGVMTKVCEAVGAATGEASRAGQSDQINSGRSVAEGQAQVQEGGTVGQKKKEREDEEGDVVVTEPVRQKNQVNGGAPPTENYDCGSKDLRFSLVKMACMGVVMFCLPEGSSICPVAVVSQILEDARAGRPRWCQRIHPVQTTCPLEGEAIGSEVHKLMSAFLERRRRDGDEQSTVKFAVGYKSRANAGQGGSLLPGKGGQKAAAEVLGRAECIVVVASAVEQAVTCAGLKAVVDLTSPEVAVMVEVVPVAGARSALCALSILPSAMITTKPKIAVRLLAASST
ncbi:hypothetical protein CBR_g51236 [Chara braunii]|uniref:THUMP domain-containing protein n=1 Tax=Chara braunii TaxID=69332 RepID=A0A388M8D5_CHABU|nr:hypothetical protein CBR_g51236 [Chara braunii]|eukprot:GBG90729.1 hypothetical protein CBR_g51236 [Chara braunii]